MDPEVTVKLEEDRLGVVESCQKWLADVKNELPVTTGLTIKLEEDWLGDKSRLGLPLTDVTEGLSLHPTETEPTEATLPGIKFEVDPLGFSLKKEEPSGPDFEFSDVDNFTQTWPEIDPGPPFSCKTCDRSFSREIALQRHMGQCQKPACPCCNGADNGSDHDLPKARTPPQHVELTEQEEKIKKTKKKDKLKKTKEEPTGDTQLCSECGIRIVAGNLARHLLIHSGQRPFPCDICDARFTQSNDVTKHMRIHTGQRPFICSACGATFAEQYGLARHERTHSKRKQHGCDVCKARFKEKYSLTVHMRIHTGEKPFACLKCSARFAGKTNLTRHNLVQHKIKPDKCKVCVCSVCGVKCPSKGSLTKHGRKHLKPIQSS